MEEQVSSLDQGQEWLDGRILLLDKPYGWSSFHLVKKVRVEIEKKFHFHKLKVGHGGTLDPLATGLMVIGIGGATKKLEALQAENKEYLTTIRLGATTPSYDLETTIDQQYPYDHITPERLKMAMSGFLGEQEQVPPLFSAKKIDGIRAYKYARKGTDKLMKSHSIQIFSFELIDFTPPDLTVRVLCSKGTYVRSLAQDLGKCLGSGAHLLALRRTRSGDFSIQDSWTVEEFVENIRGL